MSSMTHREYLLRLEWLEEQFNNPSLTDYYLMQIAQEVRRVLSKKAKSIKLKHFLIKFVTRRGKRKTSQQRTDESKAAWYGLLGIKRDDRETPS